MNTATGIINFQVEVLTASDMLVNVYVCVKSAPLILYSPVSTQCSRYGKF